MRGPRGQRGVPVSTKGAFHLSELAGQTVQFVNVCTNLKDKFYSSPLHFFKITRFSSGVIILQDFATPSRHFFFQFFYFPRSFGSCVGNKNKNK